MNFFVYQASHIGDRRYNQDRVAYAVTPHAVLLVLADGMGGHLHGEQAAQTAIDVVTQQFVQQAQQAPLTNPGGFLEHCLRQAHQQIMQLAGADQIQCPGTTCVAAVIQDNQYYGVHAGDSRLYLLRQEQVIFRTTDHSMVELWVQQGHLTPDQARAHPARNQITSCLGGSPESPQIDHHPSERLLPNDTILLCSDGLWEPMSDQELARAFYRRPDSAMLDEVMHKAYHRKQHHADNITGLFMNLNQDYPSPETVPVIKQLEIK